MIGIFLTVFRFEVLSLLRMRETYSFVLLPAVLFVPVLVAVVTLVSSFASLPVLALPEQDPPGLDLGDALDEHYQLLRTHDPSAAVDRGEAEVAIVSWDVRGIDIPRDSWFPVPVPAPAWVTAGARGSPEDRDRLASRLETAVRDALDRVILDKGGEVEADRRIARVGESAPPKPRKELPFDARRVSVMMYVGFALYGACFLIPVRTAAERLSGVLEALAVTPTPLLVSFVARVLGCTLLVPSALALPTGVLLLLIGDTRAIDLRFLDAAEGMAVLVFGNTLLLMCGVLASSGRLALYAASYLVIAICFGFGLAAYVDLPYAPVLGLGLDPVGVQIGRIAATFGSAVVGFVVTAVLVRRERVLPPALGGE